MQHQDWRTIFDQICPIGHLFFSVLFSKFILYRSNLCFAQTNACQSASADTDFGAADTQHPLIGKNFSLFCTIHGKNLAAACQSTGICRTITAVDQDDIPAALPFLRRNNLRQRRTIIRKMPWICLKVIQQPRNDRARNMLPEKISLCSFLSLHTLSILCQIPDKGFKYALILLEYLRRRLQPRRFQDLSGYSDGAGDIPSRAHFIACGDDKSPRILPHPETKVTRCLLRIAHLCDFLFQLR